MRLSGSAEGVWGRGVFRGVLSECDVNVGVRRVCVSSKTWCECRRVSGGCAVGIVRRNIGECGSGCVWGAGRTCLLLKRANEGDAGRLNVCRTSGEAALKRKDDGLTRISFWLTRGVVGCNIYKRTEFGARTVRAFKMSELPHFCATAQYELQFAVLSFFVSDGVASEVI